MRFLFATAAVVALLAPCAAHAQNDDDIVVTATRAPARVATLPAQVTIIDVDAAQAHGIVSIADALREAPGLNVIESGGAAGQQTSLFAGGANSNHTLVLFDGLRINDPSTPGSSFDAGQDTLGGLERIEVVQGPMSAVFGSDAIGGVVNLIPRHGGNGAFNGRISAAYGSFNTRTGLIGADGTLGAFRYAVTAEEYRTDGFDLVPARMSTHTGEKDGSSMSTITGVFDYAISDAFALDLLIRHREAQADFDPFIDFFPLPERRMEDDNLEISKNDLDVVRLGATWTLSDTLNLRATVGGMHEERAQADDGQVTDLFDGKRRFGDLTLNWRPGDVGALSDVNVVAGFSAEREEADIAQGFGFPPPSFFTRADQDQYGGFVSAEGSVSHLTLTGALRVDDYEGFGTHATWRGGASYAFTDNARIYAAYGTAFRAPTLYERFVSFGNPDLDPEQSKSWELGSEMRFAAFGQADGIELGAFYRHSAIDDLINFGSSFSYDNVDRATIDTAELRFGGHPLSWLTANVAYVYTDAQNDDDGSQLLRRPKNYWTADIGINHGPFSATLSWREVGERSDQLYGDDGNSLGIGDTPRYDVTRLSLGYDLNEHTQIYLAAGNLFDEDYEPGNAFAGAPRNATAGIRAQF